MNIRFAFSLTSLLRALLNAFIEFFKTCPAAKTNNNVTVAINNDHNGAKIMTPKTIIKIFTKTLFTYAVGYKRVATMIFKLENTNSTLNL